MYPKERSALGEHTLLSKGSKKPATPYMYTNK